MGILQGRQIASAIHGTELYGAEWGMITALSALASEGAAISVFLTAGSHPVASECERRGFRLVPVGFRPQWSIQWIRKHGMGFALRNFLAVFRVSIRVLRSAPRGGYDMFLIGNPLAFSYLSLGVLLSRAPMVSRHGDYPPTESAVQMILWRLMKLRSMVCVANSGFVKREIQSVRGVVASGVSVIYNYPRSSGRSVETTRGTGEGPLKVLYVGQFGSHKGLQVLMEAVKSARLCAAEIQLVAVGGLVGSQEMADRERDVETLEIGECTTLLAHRSDLGPFWEAADVHVLPSLWPEPSGNVIVEAKSQGVPTICFPVGGAPEYVVDGQDGWICSDASAGDLARILVRLASHRGELQVASRRALENFDERFGWERFVGQWVSVCQQVLRTPVSRS